MSEQNTLTSEQEKRFNERFTYGGITGVAALNPEKFNNDDPRPFKQFLAQELTQQATEILDSISETVEASPQPQMHNELRKKLTTLRTQYGVEEEK